MLTPPTRPEDINAAFEEAFNARRIDDLLSLYESDAVLRLEASGSDIVGHLAIAAALQKLMQAPDSLYTRNCYCVRHGDLALIEAEWELRDTGGHVTARGRAAEVAHRQPDGTWRYRIDQANDGISDQGV